MTERRGNIVRVSAAEAKLMKGQTDYARLDAMTDEDIARAVADDPDAAPLDIDWDRASLVIPATAKDIITLRLDHDVLEWLRSTGKGYQTRINQVLRAWYQASVRPKKTISAEIKVRKLKPHVTTLEKRLAAAKTSRSSKAHASKKGRVSR
jgi:uncharacterized protein (DUF4415 family)